MSRTWLLRSGMTAPRHAAKTGPSQTTLSAAISFAPKSLEGALNVVTFRSASHATRTSSSLCTAARAPGTSSTTSRSSCRVSVATSERRVVRMLPWKRGPLSGSLRKSFTMLRAGAGIRLQSRSAQAGLMKLLRPDLSRPRQSSSTASQKNVPGGMSQMCGWVPSIASASPATSTIKWATERLVMTSGSPAGSQRRLRQSRRMTLTWHSGVKAGMTFILGTISAKSEMDAHVVSSSET
mmetsp:Transcript_13012/g.35712  ORF Transcript_13012/g.35712 Transcript_13012/m.35712 type:complete len:238 (-) Transcript_13012:59-772(-)